MHRVPCGVVELELEKLRIVDSFKLAPRPAVTLIQKERKLAFAACGAVEQKMSNRMREPDSEQGGCNEESIIEACVSYEYACFCSMVIV